MSAAVTIIQMTPEELRAIVREEVARATHPAPAPAATGYLSVPQAARHAGCSQDTIREWIRSGRLPDRRIGGGRGHYRIAMADLEAAIRAPDRPAPVDPEAAVVRMLARRR